MCSFYLVNSVKWPAAESASTCCADPFGVLGDLSQPDPSQTTASRPAQASRPVASLDDFYSPPAQAAGSPNLLGDFMSQPQQPAAPQNYGVGAAGRLRRAPMGVGAHSAADLLGPLDLGGAAQLPASRAAAAAPAPASQGGQKKAAGMKGAGPMAPRGNAAVEQASAKKDPFADLFT